MFGNISQHGMFQMPVAKSSGMSWAFQRCLDGAPPVLCRINGLRGNKLLQSHQVGRLSMANCHYLEHGTKP
jgi:hypothetical protein